GLRDEGGDAGFAGFGCDGGVGDFDTELAAGFLEPADEFFVFDMIGVMVVELGRPVGAAWKSLVVGHEGRDAAGVGEVGVEEETVVAGKIGITMLIFVGERIIEFPAGTP